jgi:hypothetical protein
VMNNPPPKRTAAAVCFTCGRASRVRRRGRSTAFRHVAEESRLFRNARHRTSATDYRVIGVLATVLCACTLIMWVRSHFTGDYVYLGGIYLAFARGYCRVVNGPWPFVPGYPVVGKPFVTYPLDKVGEYHLGSGASYVPLWLLALIFTVIGGWAFKRSRVRGEPAAT